MVSVSFQKYDMLGGTDSINHSFVKIYYRAYFIDLHTSCIKFWDV